MSVLRFVRPLARTSMTYAIQRDGKFIGNHIVCYCPCLLERVSMQTTSQTRSQTRSFFSLPGSSLTKEHSEKKVIGYSMEQMYDVVSNVDDYKHFVPFCTASHVFQRSETHARANLEVGFQVISERYTSVLTLAKPNLVKSECLDGTLFNHLTCIWKFSSGPTAQSCVLNFYISFEFKSMLHSSLANTFFEQVVAKMVGAFLDRAKQLHGPSSLEGTTQARRRKPISRKGMVKRPRPIVIRDS